MQENEIDTNDKARELFKNLGLTYSDIDKDALVDLRNSINVNMRKSGYFENTYRCNDKIEREKKLRTKKQNPFYAQITCRAFYFGNREAISFNPDGFIGFAGWSDSRNLVPIRTAFVQWCIDLAEAKKHAV